MTIVIVAPGAMTPIPPDNIELPLKELSLPMLRSKIPRHLTIKSVATLLHHQATALEILSSSVLSLVLALSVCAHPAYAPTATIVTIFSIIKTV